MAGKWFREARPEVCYRDQVQQSGRYWPASGLTEAHRLASADAFHLRGMQRVDLWPDLTLEGAVHHVLALARRVRARDHLRIVVRNPSRPDDLARTLADHDVVISSVNAPT